MQLLNYAPLAVALLVFGSFLVGERNRAHTMKKHSSPGERWSGLVLMTVGLIGALVVILLGFLFAAVYREGGDLTPAKLGSMVVVVVLASTLCGALLRYGRSGWTGYEPALKTQSAAVDTSPGKGGSSVLFWVVLLAGLGAMPFIYMFTNTNRGIAWTTCASYTRDRLHDLSSFKEEPGVQISIEPYENGSKMLVVILPFSGENAFGGRRKDKMICSWTKQAGSDEWRWNGPDPERWSFENRRIDGI